MRTKREVISIIATMALGLAAGACADSVAPPDRVARVDVTAIGKDLWIGDSAQIRATPRSASGRALSGRAVTWSSSHPDVAGVSEAGIVVGVGPGTATITAQSEGASGAAAVDVYVADLLYEGKPAGLPEIMMLSLGTGAPSRLLPPYTLAGHPSATPNGARVAFVLTDSIETTDIYTADRDGAHVTRLTFDEEDSDQPAWSPDGARIAFHSTREGRAGDIWVMDADGSNPVNLTPDALPGVTDETWPAWSPDGTRIAYAGNAGGSVDIWVMHADGSGKQRLTSGIEIETEPTWSPDGSTIAYRRTGNGRTDIVLIAAGGGAATPLALGGNDRMPAWSPDGRLIAFARFPAGGGNPQLYTARPDGSDIVLRTTDYTWNGGEHPAWIRSH